MIDWTWDEQINYQNWLAMEHMFSLPDADRNSTVDALTIL